MGLTATADAGGDFKLMPQGTHLAVCNMIVDLGNQEVEWQGQKKIQHKCYIRWEVPSERTDYEVDGKEINGPMNIGKKYTVSLSEKSNLRPDLEAWRGKAFSEVELAGFELKNVLGQCCQITVTHKTAPSTGKQYATVTGVAGWPKGMERIKPEGDAFIYDDDHADNFEKLPKWIKEALGESVESAPTPPPNANGAEEFDDQEIPF